MKPSHCIIADSAPDIPLPPILRSGSNDRFNSSTSPKSKKRRLVTRQVPEIDDYPAGPTAESWSNLEGIEISTVDAKAKSCTQENEQKNLGAPVIVEALSKDLSSLSIPGALMQEPTSSFEEVISNEETVTVIVAEATNVCNTVKPTSKKKNLNIHKTQAQKKSNVKQHRDRGDPWLNIGGTSTYYRYDEHIVNNVDKDGITFETEGEPLVRSKNKTHGTIRNETVPRFYSVRNKVVVIMPENGYFSFAGKLLLKVIYGSVDIYGSVITPINPRMEVYSPRGYSSVRIQLRSESRSLDKTVIEHLLAEEGISCEMKNALIDDIQSLHPRMGILILSNLENKLTKFLQTFYPFKLFPKVKRGGYVPWTDPGRAETILQSKLYLNNSSYKDLIFDSCITQEVAEKTLYGWRSGEWSCLLVAGGKSVGKSTTVRYLINNLLRTCPAVVLLDFDPGQAECTPAGCISYSTITEPLTGPNFTHLRMPVYQLYIESVNVARCITQYIEGVKMLINKLKSSPTLSRLPIVVNTMGFTQGIGWDVIIFTIKLIRPTLVLQIMSERSKNNYPDYLRKDVVNQQQLSWATWSTDVANWNQPCQHELHVIQSQAERKATPGTDMWNMEPYQQRELVMTAYLSEILQCSEESLPNPGGFSINNAVPYVIPFSSLWISIPQACVPSSHALSVVNGNIVALCGVDITPADSGEIQTQTSGPRLLTRSPLCTCYGFGIVRGVDIERQEVFINTPIPGTTMPYVNCLVGCIPIPISLLEVNNFKNVPYIGGNDILPTSREARRGIIRMKFHNQSEDCN